MDVQSLFSKALEQDEVHEYKKVGNVTARPAKIGEKIDTNINGKTETTNTAKAGDIVVTNPGGESYIISGKKFFERYSSTSDKNVFKAKGRAFAFKYSGKDFSFMAPWGEKMLCENDDYLVSLSKSDLEIYRIEKDVFHSTYKRVS